MPIAIRRVDCRNVDEYLGADCLERRGLGYSELPLGVLPPVLMYEGPASRRPSAFDLNPVRAAREGVDRARGCLQCLGTTAASPIKISDVQPGYAGVVPEAFVLLLACHRQKQRSDIVQVGVDGPVDESDDCRGDWPKYGGRRATLKRYRDLARTFELTEDVVGGR
jgi:hypothetical protein